MNRDREILKAVAIAAKFGRIHGAVNSNSFDILDAVYKEDIPLLFRPLEGLWGAAISLTPKDRGIIITTKLPRQVQRFTLAHEVGHILLGHEQSFDKTVGFLSKHGPASTPNQEIAADTFASELLISKSLMLMSARRHNWTKIKLQDPLVVYQLSLRLGVSFAATCWALYSQNILAKPEANSLSRLILKDVKIQTASKNIIEDYRADVWKLAQGDTGTTIEGGPEDIFGIEMRENVSGGYVWELVDATHEATLLDQTSEVHGEYGSPTVKTMYLKFAAPGIHNLIFKHSRPWNQETIGEITVKIANFGKETGGYSRHHKSRAIEMVVAL